MVPKQDGGLYLEQEACGGVWYRASAKEDAGTFSEYLLIWVICRKAAMNAAFDNG
jgi:hypothetical protein